MKLGDVVRIRRIWIMQPVSYVEGLVVDIRTTRWEDNYRIVSILTEDGKIVTEPIDLVRDAKNVEYIIC